MEEYYTQKYESNFNPLSSNSVKSVGPRVMEQVKSLGISQKFIENPSFDDILQKLGSKLEQGTDENQKFYVTTDENKISLSYRSSDVVFESIIRANLDRITVQQVAVEKEKRFVDIDEISINENGIKWENKGATAKTSREKQDSCDNFWHIMSTTYDNSGVVWLRESMNGYNEITGDIEHCNPSLMLAITDVAGLDWVDFDNKQTQRRINIDTVKVNCIYNREDGSQDVLDTCCPINSSTENIKDMIPFYPSYSETVSILPESSSEINSLIQKEENPKIQEGLQEWVKGRESFSYYSGKPWNNGETKGRSI